MRKLVNSLVLKTRYKKKFANIHQNKIPFSQRIIKKGLFMEAPFVMDFSKNLIIIFQEYQSRYV